MMLSKYWVRNLFTKIPMVLRVLVAAGGISMMIPGTLTDVIGISVVAAITAFQFVLRKRQQAKGTAPELVAASEEAEMVLAESVEEAADELEAADEA